MVGINGDQGQGCGSVDCEGGVEDEVEGIVGERGFDWGGGVPLMR